jgi:hypothetical protein
VDFSNGVFSSAASAKCVGVGESSQVSGLVVTATADQMGGFFYAENQDRSSGIRIAAAPELSLGQVIRVSGILAEAANGELELAEARIWPISVVTSPRPIGMGLRDVGGGMLGSQRAVGIAAGTSNTGLLVCVWGSVRMIDSAVPATWFVIDDGSGELTKIVVPTAVLIDPSLQYVVVTGISSCEYNAGRLSSVIRARAQSDILPIR